MIFMHVIIHNIEDKTTFKSHHDMTKRFSLDLILKKNCPSGYFYRLSSLIRKVQRKCIITYKMASRVVGTVRAVAKKRLIPTKAPLVLVRDMFLMFHLIFVNDEKLQVFTVLQYYNLYSYLFVILKVNVTDIVSCHVFLCNLYISLLRFIFVIFLNQCLTLLF